MNNRVIDEVASAWTPTCGAVTFDVLGANTGAQWIGGLNAKARANANSFISKFTYGGASFLFTGDLEDKPGHLAETIFATAAEGYTPGVMRSTVYKLGHHGSKDATEQTLLDFVNPKLVVNSAGHASVFGHPNCEAFVRLYGNGNVQNRAGLMIPENTAWTNMHCAVAKGRSSVVPWPANAAGQPARGAMRVLSTVEPANGADWSPQDIAYNSDVVELTTDVGGVVYWRKY